MTIFKFIHAADFHLLGDNISLLLGAATGGDVSIKYDGTNTVFTNIAGSGKADFQMKLFTSGEIEIDGNLNHDGSNIGFFWTAPVAKGVSGADLTNNVTSCGVDDTINDISDMEISQAGFTSTRNALYQLARKLKQVNDTLRDYGMLT